MQNVEDDDINICNNSDEIVEKNNDIQSIS